MKANELLWDRLSRLPKTLHPVVPEELTQDINHERKKQGVIIQELSAKCGVNIDMVRNVVYGNLKRVNYSLIKICNYLDIDVMDYVEGDLPEIDRQ